ncbi:MAG: hypothetical protein ABSF00_05085 [Candidatus Bathyarchaeia archaeon]
MDPSSVGSETPTRKRMRLKTRTALLALLILILASGTSYWLFFQQHPSAVSTATTGPVGTATTQPIKFAFFVAPPFFHVAAAEGKKIIAFVQRSTSFSGVITVDVVNPPNWVAYKPATIGPTVSNSTFEVFASKDAPKTELNLTVRASSAGVVDQFALLDMKVVGVRNITERSGSAIVYDTTKILPSETLNALTSYSNGTFVFSTMTPELHGLARGDVIIVPPKKTQLARQGLMRSVLSVIRKGSKVVVETVQASLFDEFQALNLGNSAMNFTAHSSSKSRGSSQYSKMSSIVPDYWYYDWYSLFSGPFGTSSPVDIGSGDTFSASGNFAVGITPGIHFTWSNGLDYFRIHLGFVVDEDVSLTGNAGTSLNWCACTTDNNLGTLYQDQILIFDDLVWLSINVFMEGRASGTLSQKINLQVQNQNFGYEVGPTYDTMDGCPGTDPHEQCGGWFMYNSWTAPAGDHSANPVTPGSGSDAKVEIGPNFQIAINGGLGGLIYASAWGSLSADFFMQVNSLIPRNPSWWVNWGVDAYAGIGLSLSVLWGLFTWNIGQWSWGPEPLLGPELLFEGTIFPPVVAILYPQPEQAMDVSSGVAAAGFKATAVSPQDGDLCGLSPANLVWTDEDGKLGNGCSLPGETFKRDGDYHIVFTATDSEGAISSATVHVVVTVAKPKAYIISPTATDTIYVTDAINMEGDASVGVTGLPCNQLVFTIYPEAEPSNVQTFKPTQSSGWCAATLESVPSDGVWVITLTATGTNGYQATQSVQVNVKPLNPGENPGPEVTIDQPDSAQLQYSTSTTQLVGSIKSRGEGKVNKYAWTVASGSNSPTTIGSGSLSNQDCSNGCPVSATFQAGPYCTLNTSTQVTITLTAYEGSVPGDKTLGLTLRCQAPLHDKPATVTVTSRNPQSLISPLSSMFSKDSATAEDCLPIPSRPFIPSAWIAGNNPHRSLRLASHVGHWDASS